MKKPAAVQKKPAAVKPAAVKKPAAAKTPAVVKEPAAAVQPLLDGPMSDEDSGPSEQPVHRHLCIDGFAGAHLVDLGPYDAGMLVMEAVKTLRRSANPEFSVSFRDHNRPLMRKFVLHRCTNPPGMYDLEVEIHGSEMFL